MAPLVASEPTSRPESTTDLTGPVCRCTFRSQAMFTALQHLNQLRGASYRRKDEPLVHNSWDIPPPNFAVKNYAPPIKKPPRAIAHPIEDDDVAERKKKEAEFKSSQRPSHRGCNFDTEKPNKDFIISFRIQTPNTARRIAIRNGKHPTGPYLDPKPHDYRGLPPIKSFGLPELVTSFEPDPFNIRFKNEHLDILDQSHPEYPQKIKTHLSTRKTPDPKWVPSLILHKELYRKRYAAFTRHRRLDRSVYSALMERIDEDFVKKLNKQRKREGYLTPNRRDDRASSFL